jgi:hypothetical protein
MISREILAKVIFYDESPPTRFCTHVTPSLPHTLQKPGCQLHKIRIIFPNNRIRSRGVAWVQLKNYGPDFFGKKKNQDENCPAQATRSEKYVPA